MLKKWVLLLVVTNAFASNMLDTSPSSDAKNKTVAMMKLESAFTPTLSSITLVKTNNKVNWLDSGIQVSINNQWQIMIKSKNAIHINKISLGADNDAIANQVDIDFQPGTAATYLFASKSFDTNIKQITTGQTILGIVQNIDIDDYHGYKWYSFKKFTLTLSYLDEQKNYNETSTKFILVLAK